MRKFMLLFVMMVLCCLPSQAKSHNKTLSPPTILIGDIDLEGHVTMDDCAILAQVVAGRQSLPTGVDFSAADVFADGILDYKDLSILLDYTHGNIASLPVTPNGSNTPVMFGDINGSGTITVNDLVGMANRLSNPSAPYLAKYDCYLDGSINAVDLRVLANRLAGNIPSSMFIPITFLGHRITPLGFTLGDVDGDNIVDLSDSFMLQAMLLQGEIPPASADMDQSGVIDLTDLSLLNAFLGI